MKALLRNVHEITSTSYSLSLRERVGVRGYNAQIISCILLIGLMMPGVIKSASAMNHGGMLMDEKGMIMNANSDNLPRDCPKISENVDITIHAGHKHALKFTGKMFAFDQQEWNVKPCAKINITFINDDQIRYQLMIHGLPGYLYPEGMFHLELYGMPEWRNG